MTDKSKPPQSSDGLENQDLPGNDVNNNDKSNSKAERIRKNAQSRSISSDKSDKTILSKVDANVPNKSDSKSERIRENARRRSIQGPSEKAQPSIEKSESQDSQVGQPEPAETQVTQQEPVEDELLADIRHALVEEASKKQEKKERGVFHRVAKLFKSDKAPSMAEPDLIETVSEDVDLAAKAGIEKPATKEPDISSSNEVESFFAELIESSQLDAQNEAVASAQADTEVAKPVLDEEPVAVSEAAAQDILSPQPQPDDKIAAETLRSSAVLRLPGDSKLADESFENIREVALEDYSVVPESAPSVPLRKKLRIFTTGLRPFERVLFVGVFGLMVITGLLIGANFLINKFQAPETLPGPTLNVPLPLRVTLPGGWAFDLRKGKVENGRWNPTGAEWLEGTELCKWVAVPYSLQLEAVLRTLKLNDSIELTMSNADILKFKVQSIKEVPVDQIGTLEKTSNCLLLILANQKADTRWVITAIP